MKLPVFFFALVLSGKAIATDDQTIVTEPTSFHGVIARRSDGGYVSCTVSYDPEANTYAGTEYNRGYSQLQWNAQPLRPFDAKHFYNKFLREAAAAQSRITTTKK